MTTQRNTDGTYTVFDPRLPRGAITVAASSAKEARLQAKLRLRLMREVFRELSKGTSRWMRNHRRRALRSVKPHVTPVTGD
jgi:hypothetical protein